MTRRRERFAIGDPANLQVKIGAGSVRVLEGDPGEVSVEIDGRTPDRFVIERMGLAVTIRQEPGVRGGHEVTITTPAGAGMTIAAASANVDVHVPIADLDLSIASGETRVARIERNLTTKAASGDLRVDDARGRVKVTTASGDVQIRHVGGEAAITGASGDVLIEQADDDVIVRAASGDIRVVRFLGHDFRAATVSGDVFVGIPRGRSVDVDLRTISGEIRTPATPTATSGSARRVRVRFSSVSGDFELAAVENSDSESSSGS